MSSVAAVRSPFPEGDESGSLARALEAAFEAAPTQIDIKDEAGRYLMVNAEVERYLGAARERIIGRTVHDFAPREVAEAAMAHHRRVWREGKPGELEQTVERAGQRRHFLAIRFPVRDTDGAVVAVATIHRDITERWKTARSLARASERLELITATTVDGIYDWDLRSGRLWHSPGFKSLLGYSEAELGDSFEGWASLLHPDDRARAVEAVDDALAGLTDFRAEYRLLARSGDYRWLVDQGKVIGDDSGRAVRMIGSMHDISELKKAEELARESEARLAHAQRIARVGSWDWNVETGRLRWSDELYRIFGLAPGEAALDIESYYAAVHPDDRANLKAAVENAVATAEPFLHDYRIVRPDGETRIVHEHSEISAGADGRPARMRGIVQDVTEQKAAEERLRRSEEKFRNLVANIPGVIYRSGSDGWAMEFMSDAIEAYTGRPAAHFVEGGPDAFAETIHADDRAWVEAAVAEALSGDAPLDIEYRVCHADGSVRWVQERAHNLTDDDGRTRWFDGAIFDITERKQAIEALARTTRDLRESESRFRSMVENVPGAIYRCADDADWSMHYLSGPIEDITGYPAADFIDNAVRSYQSIIHPEDGASIREVAEQALVAREPFAVEYRIMRADGRTRWVLEKGRGLHDETGRLHWIDGAIFDITSRKEAEEALARSNEELQQFAYVASHDLQEPLRMVASYCQLLERRYAEQLDSDAREFIGFAVDGATRMQALINDLLSYSRVGMRGKEFKPTSCESVLEIVLQNLRALRDERAAEVSHGPLPTIQADAGQLVQLFQNLITNAIKYCREETPKVHVGAERSHGGWVFSVRDNGIGIDPQYGERIFGIFQRLQTRDQYEGTGIGLAVCRKIVERHRGRIWVESEPGQGSEFRFTIPDGRKAGDD